MWEFVLKEYLEKLMEPKALITLVALIGLVLVLFIISKTALFNIKVLTYGALAVAIAFVLSYIRIVRFPNGGTITLASMLPIFAFAYMAGPRAGVAAGLCYGLLQAVQDPFIVAPAQFILDYPLAFSLLGISGMFRKNMYLGALVGAGPRLLCHFLSGVVFFEEFANGQNVYLYSLSYNISYMLPEVLICMAVLAVPNIRSAIMRVAKTA